MSDVRIKFSDKLIKVLKIMDDNNSYIAYELLTMNETGFKYVNHRKISDMDISKKDYHFLVKIDNNDVDIKIGEFLREYFVGLFDRKEISDFAIQYTRLLRGQSILSLDSKPIEVSDFVYNPRNIRSTFLSLVTKTYPHGHEEEVLQFLPKLEKDDYGNYFKIIGDNPTVMFTSHLDTADREQKTTKLYSKKQGEEEIIFTDGNSILGADDKSGVTLMLWMMDNNIKGLYYFFIGEERGGIGSTRLANMFEKTDHVKNIKKCISFDRRRTISVITHQLGRQCCSNEFGTALCKELNKSGLNLSLDTTGVYTDSASLMDDIPECTNISVGYENEHTGRELQNITYLEKLSKALLEVNWEGLPVKRKVGINQEILSKNKKLIENIKSVVWDLETKIIGFDDKIYIRIDLSDGDISSIYNTLESINKLLKEYKIDLEVLIIDTFIKIELK